MTTEFDRTLAPTDPARYQYPLLHSPLFLKSLTLSHLMASPRVYFCSKLNFGASFPRYNTKNRILYEIVESSTWVVRRAEYYVCMVCILCVFFPFIIFGQ